jgi:hypothetical protein
MNRHHPYGGPYDSPARRGGSPPGPGPDRSHHRFPQDNRGGGPPRGRGGFGRGRGYGGYDGGQGHSAYDQGPPYNSYDNGPQDPFYQNTPNTGYGGPPPQFGVPPGPSNDYTQGFNNFEGALEIKTEMMLCNAQGGTLESDLRRRTCMLQPLVATSQNKSLVMQA